MFDIQQGVAILIAIRHLGADLNIFRRGGGEVFPLRLLAETHGKQDALFSEARSRVNLHKEFLQALAGVLGTTPDPEKVLGYLYALLHSPAYRTRYAEFLKRDFPRAPMPPDAATFDALARLGRTLIDLHLLRDPALQMPACKYPAAGDHRVARVRYDDAHPRVWINEAQCFEPVPPEVWAFRVGGYQVCEKWLSDRKGATLSYDERLTYQKMVTALDRTLALQQQIDAIARAALGVASKESLTHGRQTAGARKLALLRSIPPTPGTFAAIGRQGVPVVTQNNRNGVKARNTPNRSPSRVWLWRE